MAAKLCSLLLLVPVFLLLEHGVFCSPALSSVARSRRSDDPSPIDTVVDRLSQQVSLITGELNALKARSAKQESSVAFHVHHNGNPYAVAPGGVLILSSVLTNVGNGYDPNTGVFTVPLSGLYDMQVTFMAHVSTSQLAYAGLFVDNTMVAEGVADSRHSSWDQTTIRAIVHVTSGQKVFVKNVYVATADYFTLLYTIFSGFLIQAD